MKAIYQDEYGPTTYKIGELPDPTAGDGEVLVRVHAAGVNPIDIKRHLFCSGETFPLYAGYDLAGVVEALGSGVTDLAVGDRVYGCVVADPGAKKVTGAFGELAALPSNLLARMPEGTTFEQMAATPVAIATAIQVFDNTGLSEGHKVFVSGGAGGVGIHAMQLAKSVFGAAEVATTASEPKFEFVREHGADKIINYKTQDAGEELKGWADVAFDCTGEPDMVTKIAREDGKAMGIVQFGHEKCPFHMLNPSTKLMERIGTAITEGKLNVVIDKVYKFEDGLEAIKYQAAGRAKGKIVIKIIE